MQKKPTSHYIYTHVLTHTYICLCTYIYVCIWKKEMHTACHVGFLCVWGRWFSVKCRALYKLLFFSNKAEMYLLLPLFIWEGKVPWFWQMFCSSLPFGERVMEEGGGRNPLSFLKTSRNLRMDLVLSDPEPSQAVLPRMHAVGSLLYWDMIWILFRLNVFEYWWT